MCIHHRGSRHPRVWKSPLWRFRIYLGNAGGLISIALQLRTTGILLHHNIHHIFVIYPVLSVPKKESFCQRDLAFLQVDFLAMMKIHIICGCGNVQTVPFRKNWEITQTFLFKSAVFVYAVLALSSICWQVGPDPMICVARQGPGGSRIRF